MNIYDHMLLIYINAVVIYKCNQRLAFAVENEKLVESKSIRYHNNDGDASSKKDVRITCKPQFKYVRNSLLYCMPKTKKNSLLELFTTKG